MPDQEWDRLRPHFQVVKLDTNDILHTRHRPIEHAYFPTRGCVSLVIDFHDGFQAEAGLIGFEGMVGVPVILGAKSDIATAVAQAPTEALRIPAAALQRELAHTPALKAALLRYGDATRAQAMQLAACNGHHHLDARLARCLLTMQDRHRGGEVPITHELLAGLLCAHRPSVSVAAKRLQCAGLIRYAAGQVVVADRVALEDAACECYQIIRDHAGILQDAGA